MRDILFRGKRLDNGKWHYGSYLFLHVPESDWKGQPRGAADDVHFIVDREDINFAVDPATVGQYTGLNDVDGEKIFEGDIIKGAWGTVLQVWFDPDYLQFRAVDAQHHCREIDYYGKVKITGNIFDQGHLIDMKGRQKDGSAD